jgi:hypothetical protein
MNYSKVGPLPNPHDFFYQSNSYDIHRSTYGYAAINAANGASLIQVDYNQECNIQVFVLDENTSTTNTPNPITTSQIHRLYNAAVRIALDIIVVGSRANGTASETSDWDYIINELNNHKWKKIKNSMPGARTRDRARHIDIVRTPLDVSKPYIAVHCNDDLEKLLGYGKISYITSQ